MLRWAVLMIAAAGGSGALAADDLPKAPGARDVEFFERKVRPLLAEHCHQCHSTKAKNQRGGLLLDGRDALLAGGDSGPAVVVGRPEQSLLIRAVRYQDERLQMPPRGKLPERDVAVLAEWVARGVPRWRPTAAR